MLPYLGWTCFATTLINCSLWDSNPAVVQSAHKVAQVKPQIPPDSTAQTRSRHTRNNTAPGELGRIAAPAGVTDLGGVVYSDRPILGHISASQTASSIQPSWEQYPQQRQQQQQQQHWHQQQQPLPQPAGARAQPAVAHPFAEASTLHRRSATQSDRRTTRRTSDDEGDRFVTHTDSGHLIIPQGWDKPEHKSSTLFSKVS